MSVAEETALKALRENLFIYQSEIITACRSFDPGNTGRKRLAFASLGLALKYFCFGVFYFTDSGNCIFTYLCCTAYNGHAPFVIKCHGIIILDGTSGV